MIIAKKLKLTHGFLALFLSAFACFLFSSFLLKMNEINIVSLKINGVRDIKKRMEIYEFVKQNKMW